MASPAPEPPSTGVVALDSAHRTLSVIIAADTDLKDHATDIHYSADALSRLTELFPRSIRTLDNMDQVSHVSNHFILQFPNWKSPYNDEACTLYHTIAEGLSRLLIKEEVYLAIMAQYGRVLVNNKIRDKRLLKVEGDIERLLEILLEIEREDGQFFENTEGEGEDALEEANPTSSSSLGHQSQPVWIDEQTKISNDELRYQWFNRDNYCQPPSLVAQDPRLMTLVELRKNGEFVRHALFDKGSESWPN
ncbi:hypothetical protein GE21DRAFT_8203 [Neurospora crassa]|uniref:Uncharacterized protein n=2 Tax=Neurospora crassa TaxID=5141 RepID=Q1K7C8_NEUCR|nr:hypothetical protein NCU04209 [Neurospora crassa OR74A]EAA31933.1 hypothetical protein NCU04209 [Neurospora crassa OR74A]KHE86059.1 hypothetical protein GE21DRAFT_8203 [Neurospora crassa]CAD36986.1 hypothetical protein [Neurospora crassa]|eukprot:XP_961169.1 hypothetical protein NCU04209 [Neurospora crassa OR74A]